MYTKCARLTDARAVFDQMPTPNIFSWNVMIGVYANQCQGMVALELYCRMQRTGIQPDGYTFPCILKACARLTALQQGKAIHVHVLKSGFESDVFVRSALVAMYTKCRRLDDARQMFDKMSQRDAVSWNAMIRGYAQNKLCEEALKLYREMQLTGVEPTKHTITIVLPACGSMRDLQ